MRIAILTIFPEMFESVLGSSILGRARREKLVEIEPVDIRPFSDRKHKNTDDYPFGGGAGMVMLAQPICDAVRHLRSQGYTGKCIYMSPRGKTLTQQKVVELAQEENFILLCGHYEGVDQRAIDAVVDEELSLGDFVLTGGEIPAMAVADCLCRMVPGVLPEESCYTEESHWDGLLEYPQYSRPEEWHGRKVPAVLLSGHHGNVADWRKKESYKRTMLRRPDMFAKFDETMLTTKHDRKVLAEAKAEFAAMQAEADNKAE